MANLVVTCECGQKMKVPEDAAGKRGTCIACGQRLKIKKQSTVKRVLWREERARSCAEIWANSRTAIGNILRKPKVKLARYYAKADEQERLALRLLPVLIPIILLTVWW